MLKGLLFFIFSITVVAIASTVLCIFNYNPYAAATYQFIFFYLSIFSALTGILSLLIYLIKVYFFGKDGNEGVLWSSVRQGFIVSLSLTSVLILRGLKLFDAWVAFPLLLVFILLEMFFQTKKRFV